MVRAGELLAEIDPRLYQAALDQAKGALARDQALYANARIDLQRYQSNGFPDSRAGHGYDSLNSRGESSTSAQWFIHETLRSNLRIIATN